jgi:hypothetical protein
MRCTAQEMVDAIIDAAARRGADGRGRHGLDGHMSMLASTSLRKFGILLGGALRLKMKPGRGEDDERPELVTLEQAKARLREAGLPESFADYLRPVDCRTEQRKRAQPNGTRSIVEAVINAAIRHGSDGRGKDGLLGYMLMLERIPIDFTRSLRA